MRRVEGPSPLEQGKGPVSQSTQEQLEENDELEEIDDEERLQGITTVDGLRVQVENLERQLAGATTRPPPPPQYPPGPPRTSLLKKEKTFILPLSPKVSCV